MTLYKYRGEVDLILADPPYNTGKYFRYNDRWDEDPNDPDLGTLVTFEDGGRHTKWMKMMLPRLHMMKAMLRDTGVIAICIDDNELFHLGMMMDEVFGESNRIAIINWQKAYSPKSDSRHVSGATEYVLVYAKDKSFARTGLEARTEEMDGKYTTPDNDPHAWKSGDASAPGAPTHRKMVYAIQSPFTGKLYYPSEGRCWGNEKKTMKQWLEEWGSEYQEKWIDDGNEIVEKGREKPLKIKALVLKGTKFTAGQIVAGESHVEKAREAAQKRLKDGIWPPLYFGLTGETGPQQKRYLKEVKKGKVPMTYWADEEYDTPFELGTQSWDHEESGHSQQGVNELSGIVGKGHGFETVKPLKLFKKIIQLWCRPSGLVLDPFAGSGTTAHAVLELNHDAGAERRFILIEQGRPENSDPYASTLTQQRVQRAVTGERASTDGTIEVSVPPLGGGFEFRRLTRQIDANAIVRMKRDELIDVVVSSHFEAGRRRSVGLMRVDDRKHQYLVGHNDRHEGYFVIWGHGDAVGQLDEDIYDIVLEESRRAGLKAPHHVYARYEIFQSDNVRFYQIPDRILAHLGFNEFSEPYNAAEPDQHEES